MATSGLLLAARSHTGGRLVYALDDAYIHMAVAGNLVEHGVWGVTRHGFTGATSSLLWPLMLAAAEVVGVPHHTAPLVLNVLFALAAVGLASWWLRDRARVPTTVALLIFVFVVPLPTLVVAGMEHVLHVVSVLMLATALMAALADEPPSPRAALALFAVSALTTAVRYESLFLVAAGLVALAWLRRPLAATALLAGGALPPLAYALAASRHGWPPLPLPLLLKGAMPSLSGVGAAADLLGARAARELVGAPHLLVLLLLVAAAGAFSRGPVAARRLAGVTLGASALHLQFASTGWLYRYEAYLVALAIVVAAALVLPPRVGMPSGIALPPEPLARRTALAGLALACLPLASRGLGALADAPAAARNIYEQQWQMGLFLARHYTGASVMANDIGAISDLADIRLLDLYGLATLETARARRAGQVDRALLERLTAEARPEVIVIYRSWFARSLPASWVEVGSWRIARAVVAADRTVTFYAPDAVSARRLLDALESFRAELPPGVSVRLPGEPAPES